MENMTSQQSRPTFYLCSQSKIKMDALARIANGEFDIVCLDPSKDSGSTSKILQPINEGTAMCCSFRITEGIKLLRGQGKKISPNAALVAIENGIYIKEFADSQANEYYDVCVIMICDFDTNGDIKNITRHNSFGIKIDSGLFKTYLDMIDPNCKVVCDTFLEQVGKYNNTVFCKENDLIGFAGETYGQYLAKLFLVPHDNWMADPRFGNIDRKKQIADAFDKFTIDGNTDVVPDYPKPGVMFKDMTSITIKHDLLNVMYSLLERLIIDNFDLDNIDYFAGLDARGFYLAPVLARVFKKGFIPVRKINKLPITTETKTKIATESYDTEYSSDQFGLQHRFEYIHSTKKKTVVILDDLLATGGSIVGAAQVLKQVGLEVLGAVTVYDVPALRQAAKEKLASNNIPYRVLINNNNVPNDFTKLAYVIPDVMYKRIDYMLQEAKSPDRMIFTDRQYTLTPEQWLVYDGKTRDQIENMDMEKMENVRMIFTEKDKNLAVNILDVLRQQTNADLDVFSRKYRASITNEKFSNGEIHVKIDANIRDKHVIVISQIRTGHINDDIMELLLIMDACNRAGVDKVTVVMPYYPYSRSDKKDDPRCPIAAAMMANLLKALDTHNLISVDLHAGQIQGYLDHGFHNLYCIKYMCEHIYQKYLRFTPKEKWNDEYILIAPDAGSAKMLKGYSKILGINNVVLDKQRDYSKPGTVMNSRMIGSREDLLGKTGIIIDDMIDTMGTMASAAKELVENGLKDVIVCATHGILSGEALKRINETPSIKEVTVTDSLPQDDNVAKCPKLIVLSIGELIGRSIDGLITGRSVSRLF